MSGIETTKPPTDEDRLIASAFRRIEQLEVFLSSAAEDAFCPDWCALESLRESARALLADEWRRLTVDRRAADADVDRVL